MTWSPTSKRFHWTGAALIFFLLIHGFWMMGLAREDEVMRRMVSSRS